MKKNTKWLILGVLLLIILLIAGMSEYRSTHPTLIMHGQGPENFRPDGTCIHPQTLNGHEICPEP